MNADDSFFAVKHALQVGYRHFDSAEMYGTEKAIGQAVRGSEVDRSEVFITSKTRKNGYWQTKEAIETGLKSSGLEYFDLYMPHSPYGGTLAREGTWRAMVEAKTAGKIRSLGVSNFGVHHMREIELFIANLEREHGKGNGGEVSVGQWELHPWLDRPDIVKFCTDRNIVVQAYCPLVRGQRMDEAPVKTLARKYGKSGAQILIRWSLQKVRTRLFERLSTDLSLCFLSEGEYPFDNAINQGYVPLPKSSTPSRIEANADVYDFELLDEDMSLLKTEDFAPCTWNPAAAPLER